MAAWIGPAISAGASVLGGLFGKDDEKQSNRVDYKQMVADAEAAGFNPLTVLRAGGAAGYTQTSHPALSSVNAFGTAMEAVGNFAMNFDADADKRRQAEYDLVQAQIANIQGETAQRAASMNAPKRNGSNAVSDTGRPVADPVASPKMMLPWATPLAVGPAPVAGEPTVTNPYPRKGGLMVNPNFKDAETSEARYGDIAQEFFGAVNMIADTAYTFQHDLANRTSVRKLSKKEQDDLYGKSWLPSWVPRIEYRPAK